MRVVCFKGAAVIAAALALGGEASAEVRVVRVFADRPVAIEEHDDGNIAGTPAVNRIQEQMATEALRGGLTNEIDRIMSLDTRTPALDVNAADQVPCSTWYCAGSDPETMKPEELVAAATSQVPRLPLTVIGGKSQGDAPGYRVVDADGRKFLIKLDVSGHLGMATSAELIGNAIFRAAGYNVPGASLVEFDEATLAVDPHATYLLYRVQKRPLTASVLRAQLAAVARLPDGRVRAVAVPWLEGKSLGAFEMKGTRPGDPNDRIPHERRRSLRASRVLFMWLSVLDSGEVNTLDTLVEAPERRYVRHAFIDFGSAFGSATNSVQGLHQDYEYSVEIGRTLAALFSLGIYQRPFQRHRAEYQAMVNTYTAVGYYPAEGFNPDAYRSQWKNAAFMRMTDPDAYWGAKLVTSFTNEDIAALVVAARLHEPDASYLKHALQVRRDILGRRYLRPMTAVEAPMVSEDGASVCFDDLAVKRGYVTPADARYEIDVSPVGPEGVVGKATRFEQASEGPRACVPLGTAGPGSGYRVVEIRTHLAAIPGVSKEQVAKAARVHLRWRPAESRFVVVGLERDE